MEKVSCTNLQKTFFFPIETKRKASCIPVKEDYPGRIGRNTQDLARQGSGELHVQSCSQHKVYHMAPGVPSSPDLTVIPCVAYFMVSVCRNHTIHWASWHIVKALLMSKWLINVLNSVTLSHKAVLDIFFCLMPLPSSPPNLLLCPHQDLQLFWLTDSFCNYLSSSLKNLIAFNFANRT